MKSKYLPLVGLVIGIGFATAGRERTFGDGELPAFLRPYDLDENGQIDEEERQAAREARRAARDERRAERIAELDTDEDGEISHEERDVAREAMRAAIEAKRAEKFAEIAGEDGCLDADEFAALPPLEGKDPERVANLFDRLDSSDDGCVDLAEFTARLRHHRKPSRHDHHGDGGGEDIGDRPTAPPRPLRR